MTTTQTVQPRLSLASLVNLGGIIVFGAMIVVQIAGGVDNYPTIPPGLVISLAVIALTVLGARWRWTTLVALTWPIVLGIGAVLASGSMEALSGEQGLFIQVTGIIQRATLVVGIVAGAMAAVQRYRPARHA
ncbi:hypothetical protein ABT304_29600 [Nocardioides sp. NPDC000445]|uniref:hypothetical protein n=1 Tax=Nocardioides sp. NPDC000445 TaxID=3154257 RepID=UPI00333206F0